MWPFGKPLLDDETIRWVLANAKWFLRHTNDSSLYEAPVVLPNDSFFPVDTRQNEDRIARDLFDLTRCHAGMSQWDCRLQSHKNAPRTDQILEGVPYGQSKSQLTLSFANAGPDEVLISIASELVQTPEVFIVQAIHQLAHHLTSTFPDPPPGGDENAGFSTELAIIWMGFGVLLLNNAFQFSQFTEGLTIGWQTSRSGYLSDGQMAYGLATFLMLSGRKYSDVKAHLHTNARADVKAALKDLKKRWSDDIDVLLRRRRWVH